MSKREFDQTILREYDIRGIVGQDLDSGVSEAVGRAFASHVRAATGLASPRVAVGHDNRMTSPDLAAGLIGGIGHLVHVHLGHHVERRHRAVGSA